MDTPATPLSVIVPSHGRRDLTLACLASLQPWVAEDPEIEVLLADDASPDDTVAAVAAAFPRIRILTVEGAGGFSSAANRGLAKARGEIVLVLNSDTEVEPSGRAVLANAFASRPRLGAAGGSLRYPDGTPQWSGGRFPTLRWLVGLASGVPALVGRSPFARRWRPVSGSDGAAVDWVSGAAIALRRTALAEAGSGFDEGFRFYAQDLDLCSRLRGRGWDIAVLPELRVVHHHGASIAGGGAGFADRERPELLWPDLLRWAERHRGAAWCARARRGMLAAAAVRRAARAAAGRAVPRTLRAGWQRDSAALAAGRAALTAWRPTSPDDGSGQSARIA